ncbi:sulfotransferase [Kordiimonas sp.]|uniref:sulfotransferase n=1 Tax=Kordiimonas sp. TaxID=1970157 RepID=UPI003A943F69
MPEHMTAPVLIIGIHRSGTSLLTRMLEAIGLFVGNDLQADHESLIMIQINNKYFDITNSSWDQPAYPAAHPDGENYIAEILSANAELIAERFGTTADFWGFKDPRTLTTLPYWLKTFPDAKVVYIRRSPQDIARSLTSRHQRNIKKGLFPPHGSFTISGVKFTQRCATMEGSMSFVMEQHAFYENLLKNGVIQKHLELSYEELLHDPVFQLSRLCRYLECTVDRKRTLEAANMPNCQRTMDAKLAFETYFGNKKP